MQRIAKALLLLALGLGVFAWWGLSTSAGARAFDEMDGLIPFFAGVLGVALVICASLLWWFAKRSAS